MIAIPRRAALIGGIAVVVLLLLAFNSGRSGNSVGNERLDAIAAELRSVSGNQARMAGIFEQLVDTQLALTKSLRSTSVEAAGTQPAAAAEVPLALPAPLAVDSKYASPYGLSTSGLAEPWSLPKVWLLRQKRQITWPQRAGTSWMYATNFHGNEHFNKGDDFTLNLKPGRDCWELSTFQVFKAALTRRKGALIDFGAWYGPTALFGAQFATRVLALEPDPQAFEMLRANFMANPALQAKANVFWMCISAAKGTLPMRGQGDSMSVVVGPGSPPNSKNLPEWQVPCMPLPEVAAAEGLKPGDISLIKMDMEGSEATVFPTLGPWLQEHKLPTIWLSLHCAWWGEDPAIKAKIHEVMKLYPYIYHGTQRMTNSQPADLRGLQEWLLSAEELTFEAE